MHLQQVHLRVNDAATSKPTPVRLRITDAAGNYYAPYGRLTEFATGVNQDVGGNVQIGAKKWAYIDGACEILLPPGELHIEIAKGPEYKPIDEHFTLLAGKLSLRYTIERWIDLRKDGWYSGDTRAHFLTPDAALLEGEAEDLAVVNVLARETAITDHFGKSQRAIPNILSFSGQQFARQSPTCGVAVNTHNVHPQLGSVGLLHSHRVVYPLTFDVPEWTLDDWCGQCHRKKGLVVWTDPQHQTADFLYGEPLALAILGHLDAFELTFYEDSPFDALNDYYRLLDAGIILPLVGASGKDRNAQALGAMRTYAWLHRQEPTYGAWIEAVRAGATVVTNGPLLQFGESRAPIQPSPMRTQLEAWLAKTASELNVEVKSYVPFDRLELLWNGNVIRTARPFEVVLLGADRATEKPSSGPPWYARIQEVWMPSESGWLAARCLGETLLPGCPAPQRVFAHTSPIMIEREDKPYRAKPEAVQALMAELDNLVRWAAAKQMKRSLHVIDEARTVLTKKLS